MYDIKNTMRFSKIYELLKVDVVNSITYPSWTPIYEWYVVRCDSKDRGHKGMCLKEIELCAQNTITILSSIFDIIGGDQYDHSMSMRMFTLTMKNMFI